MEAEDGVSDDEDWAFGNLARGKARLQNSAHDAIVFPVIISG